MSVLLVLIILSAVFPFQDKMDDEHDQCKDKRRRKNHTVLERQRRSEQRILFDRLQIILKSDPRAPRLRLLSLVSSTSCSATISLYLSLCTWKNYFFLIVYLYKYPNNWFTEIDHLFLMSPAHFKPTRKAQTKQKTQISLHK